MALLRQNSRLRPLGIYQFTLPAWVQKLPDGRTVNVCPSAGVCAQVCYARQGTYLIPSVRRSHVRNLLMVLDDLPGFEAAMHAELHQTTRSGALKFAGKTIRLHDSGDFLSADYLRAWLRIMRAASHARFYCYPKEIQLFREHVEPDPPPNFSWVFSFGGRQDASLNPSVDRVADVFATEAEISEAGYHSQSVCDTLAVDGPAPVGLPANRIPRFQAVQAGRRWSAWQASVDAARAAKLARHQQIGPDAETIDNLEGDGAAAVRDVPSAPGR
jgi:hypothetical protein